MTAIHSGRTAVLIALGGLLGGLLLASTATPLFVVAVMGIAVELVALGFAAIALWQGRWVWAVSTLPIAAVVIAPAAIYCALAIACLMGNCL